jgi:uncharacterized membrane protein YbhN (UPF0104 family)
VFLPEFVAWTAGLCITAVFLAAYDIPVTFHTVMGVTGSNSISNTVSLTPGGAGVNQAFNVAALKDVADSHTATAYSASQQLISTAWSILVAVVLLVWVFGWAGGRSLVEESYEGAKAKVAEQKAAREAAKAADFLWFPTSRSRGFAAGGWVGGNDRSVAEHATSATRTVHSPGQGRRRPQGGTVTGRVPVVG